MATPAQFAVRWPTPALSPESKLGGDRKAAAAAKARKAAFHGIRRAAPLASPPAGGAALEFVFVPPNARRYSAQTLMRRMAPTLEGIADFLRIDVAQLDARARVSRAPTPGGAVLVKLLF